MPFQIRMGIPEMEEPHPEDQKRGAYQRITLSRVPAGKLEPPGKR